MNVGKYFFERSTNNFFESWGENSNYESVFSVESKPDHSPLTLADKKSHEHIVNELQRLYPDPDIPVLSEEGR
ncbi:hypothetical protein [Parageobacillus thermoglucosidasius]|uniref:hypothetical protein n=1 Tax=Parageobacillus thermoglucosidasius TaxID=1426 RepID=UPI0018F1F2EE|nr:hypothetical protein [Parageobacillus thermoglucosidasius]